MNAVDKRIKCNASPDAAIRKNALRMIRGRKAYSYAVGATAAPRDAQWLALSSALGRIYTYGRTWCLRPNAPGAAPRGEIFLPAPLSSSNHNELPERAWSL